MARRARMSKGLPEGLPMLRISNPSLSRALASSLLGFGLAAGSVTQVLMPAPPRHDPVASARAPALTPRLAADLRSFFDPKPMAAGRDAPRHGATAPVPSNLMPAASPVVASATTAPPAPSALSRPLPSRRAETSRTGAAPATTRSARLASRRTDARTAARPGPPVGAPATRDSGRGAAVQRSFGTQAVSGPALAYAALPSDPTRIDPAEQPGRSPAGTGGVAVYDINARAVTLPSGERLEAHSGLGEALDDSRYVHLRMRGATPPGTYDLTLRESLFHGVRALRLNPVGGSATIHGRAGLLAHTFMLGPRGDSNGCVSFRNYDRFLQAFLRGEIRRLVVVAGTPQDGLQGLARRLFGMGGQAGRALRAA